MRLKKLHDKVEKFLNKKNRVVTSTVQTLHHKDWAQAKNKAKSVKVNPGWAVYFVRDQGYVDHIAIVIEQDEGLLNLAEAVLVQAAPAPIGHGLGPLTNESGDRSGLRISTAIEYIETYPTGDYKKLFVGPPPTDIGTIAQKAGKIAEEIAKSGLIDGKPIIYSFYNIPFIKKFFVTYFNPVSAKTKVESRKKLPTKAVPFYCGAFVSEIWTRAGLSGIPTNRLFKIESPTSFTIFKWAVEMKSIFSGLSWD